MGTLNISPWFARAYKGAYAQLNNEERQHDCRHRREMMNEEEEKDYNCYFGGCPECGGTHGSYNIGQEHWFVCEDHKTKWWIGSNLFSSWREESEEVWRRNNEKLTAYVPVVPLRTDERDGRAIINEAARPLNEFLDRRGTPHD